MRTRKKYAFCPTTYKNSSQSWYFRRNSPWRYSHTQDYSYTRNSTYPYMTYKVTTDELHKGPPYLVGGPLSIEMLNGSCYNLGQGICPVSGIVGNSKIIVSGRPLIIYNPYSFSSSTANTVFSSAKALIDSEVGSLSSHGDGAYQKFSPIKPHVDLGQTLAEFGELPRMLRTSAKTFSKLWRSMGGSKTHFGPKRVADEWLNNQFGWVPFLSTLIGVYETTRNITLHVKRLRKYNGKWEKRGGRVRQFTKSINVTNPKAVTKYFVTDSRFAVQFKTILQRTISVDEWFTGNYRYWIPSLIEVQYPANVIAQLYGLRISPQLLYDLIPWSWMASWFTNIRDILQTADEKQFGQLVTKGAYLMGTRTVRDSVNYNLLVTGSEGSSTSQGVINYDITLKERICSTPYGFNVHSTDLSPWKISILAALGISKYF